MAKKRLKADKVKKRKLKYKNILIFMIIVFLIILSIFSLSLVKITNIYISNNYYLSDQEIIDITGIGDYPKSYLFPTLLIRKNLVNNQMIKNAKVTKKMFTSVYIDIEENRPLFYNNNKNITVLLDGTETDNKYSVPTIVNYIPDTVYSKFFDNLSLVYVDVLQRISEIKYDPNDVDSERFLLFMDDGNYVYLTLDKFSSINNYIDIIKKFGSKKGILYLDSGEYFKIL